MLTTVEILKKARALVEKGWAQGFAVDYADRHCIATALWTADQNARAYFSAKAIVSEANGIDGMLSEWNDTPGRTQAEVLAAFDKAIELAERSNG